MSLCESFFLSPLCSHWILQSSDFCKWTSQKLNKSFLYKMQSLMRQLASFASWWWGSANFTFWHFITLQSGTVITNDSTSIALLGPASALYISENGFDCSWVLFSDWYCDLISASNVTMWFSWTLMPVGFQYRKQYLMLSTRGRML